MVNVGALPADVYRGFWWWPGTCRLGRSVRRSPDCPGEFLASSRVGPGQGRPGRLSSWNYGFAKDFGEKTNIEFGYCLEFHSGQLFSRIWPLYVCLILPKRLEI